MGASVEERRAEERERIKREVQEELQAFGQKVAFVLHPDQVKLVPCATVVFTPPRHDPDTKPDPMLVEKYERGVAMAQGAPKYWIDGEGRHLRHFARFEIQDASRLFELYQVVGDLPDGEVLIYDLPLPFARDLWLPLFWFHR